MPISLEVEEPLEPSSPVLRWIKIKSKSAFESLNSYRAYNVPLFNYCILVVFGYLLIKLSFRYHLLYTKSSLVATILTNVVLYGIADTCAQSIPGWVRSRSLVARVPTNVMVTLDAMETGRFRETPNGSQEDISSTFADYGDGFIGTTPYNVEINSDAFTESDNPEDVTVAFNFTRFIGFICWGFFMAFIQVMWYMFLNSMFNDMPTIVTILERDLVDQLCFSPVSLACFFAYTTMVIEQGSKEDYVNKMVTLYISTLFVSFSVWFPVQFVNFAIIPKNLQVPFSSSVGVLWNCFLSFRNASMKRSS